MSANLIMRRYAGEADFWRIRAFCRELFLLNGRLERSWSVPRVDYWRWHFVMTCETDPLEQVTFLWETPAGELAAVLHAITPGEAFLHVDPRLRTAALEDALFAQAERALCRTTDTGARRLVTLCDEDDALRRGVLEARGFTLRHAPVYRWRRDLDAPLLDAPAAAGCRIRSMGGAADYAARAWASWRAFHPDEPDDGFDGGAWLANLQAAPLYRRDLDIVAEAPTGEIAAFATIWYDAAARSAVCVLVGTAPEYQRRGLGKAVIAEGLRRLQRLGGTRVFANGFDPPANALYGSVLGTCYRADSWVRLLE